MDSLIRNWRRQPDPGSPRSRGDGVRTSWGGGPAPDEELRKVELAVRQLERAELYVVSAENLELARWDQRHALHKLRGEILAVQDILRRPRPLE